MDFKCPVCRKAIPSTTTITDGKKLMKAAFFPFCSNRCRLIDLGAWLDGDYRVPAEPKPYDSKGFEQAPQEE